MSKENNRWTTGRYATSTPWKVREVGKTRFAGKSGRKKGGGKGKNSKSARWFKTLRVLLSWTRRIRQGGTCSRSGWWKGGLVKLLRAEIRGWGGRSGEGLLGWGADKKKRRILRFSQGENQTAPKRTSFRRRERHEFRPEPPSKRKKGLFISARRRKSTIYLI